MNQYLAQVNIGKIIAPMNSPEMSGFTNALDEINSLAEGSAGFVWRLKEENNNATSIQVFDDPFIIINMSVWKNYEALYAFVYRSPHTEYLKRRREWFEKLTDMHMALWWVSENHIPTTADAIERLGHIKTHGPTKFSFSFKTFFPAEVAEAGNILPGQKPLREIS